MSETPTPLRDLIERGPLAEQLRPYWHQVFEAPEGPEPPDPAQAAAWQVKQARVGQLRPDAAWEIAQRLTTAERPVTAKDVAAAKREGAERWLQET